MNRFLTSKEKAALDVIFLVLLGESGANHTSDYWRIKGRYIAAALRIPKLTTLTADINQMLAEMKAANFGQYVICRFKAGDLAPLYFEFPASLSTEVVRTTLEKSGLRERQVGHKQRLARKR